MKESLIVACLCFVGACSTVNIDPKIGNDNILVDSYWVADNLNHSTIRILELDNSRGIL